MRYKYVVTLGSWLQPVQSISDINIMSVNILIQVNIEINTSSYSSVTMGFWFLALNAFLFCKLISYYILYYYYYLFSHRKYSQILLVISGSSVMGAGLAPGYGGPAPEYPELNCTLLQVCNTPRP